MCRKRMPADDLRPVHLGCYRDAAAAVETEARYVMARSEWDGGKVPKYFDYDYDDPSY